VLTGTRRVSARRGWAGEKVAHVWTRNERPISPDRLEKIVDRVMQPVASRFHPHHREQAERPVPTMCHALSPLIHCPHSNGWYAVGN